VLSARSSAAAQRVGRGTLFGGGVHLDPTWTRTYLPT
jgi:hypothetical protein